MPQKASDKEVAKILEAAENNGWTTKQKKNGWMLLAPGGGKAVMIHATNSDWRGLKNVKSVLRSAGLKV